MKTWTAAVKDAVVSGGAASITSAALLALRGRKETGSAVAPLNATSHIIHGDEALNVDRPTVRHTATGAALHAASGIFWGVLFEKLLGREREPRSAAAVARNAIKATAVAAVVDLVVVPRRLTPGFERRLSGKSLWMVYGGLAVGMAMGAWLMRRR
ncbi:hypothetical protein OOT46_18375 [Aquabacterium sp. A7-Y]|uniref:hypothetical protein n=1 Tax=Aquabacterium sp. A7-Y TaxID=1349605 RepID=UPI00223E8CD4|nr:hypothetical protein [Aquabacterium sp. A7-Y]MCW7539804.1 hypothetical protein [Aquabacterium sp. A7-Y]